MHAYKNDADMVMPLSLDIHKTEFFLPLSFPYEHCQKKASYLSIKKTPTNPTTKTYSFSVLHVLIHHVIFISEHGIRAFLKMPICFLIFTVDMK